MDIEEASRDDEARLASLAACSIMDTPREASFDNIVYTLAQLLRAPMAALTLVDRDRVWAKAVVGRLAGDWERTQTFCQHVIASADVMVVEDAQADSRFARLLVVIDEPYVRFMAGAPVFGPGRQAIGAICALDRLPRTITDRQRMNLMQLAAQAGELLRLRVPNLDVSA